MNATSLAFSQAKSTPSLTVSTPTISFGNVSIGQTATQSVVLKSTGTAPLTISTISVSGSLFAATGVATPLTLNPGQSATLTASFRPVVANPWNYTGVIAISSNSSASSSTINMSGKGVVSLKSVSCASSSMTGAGTNACTVSLTGGAPTGGQTVTLASSHTAVALPSTLTIPSGATSASFSATVSSVASPQTATVTASSAGVSQSFALQLTGPPSLSLSTTTINFGNVSIGQTATQAVVLKSTGAAPVTISAISVTGSLFGASGVITPLTLNPGQSVTLIASFKPTAANPWNYTGTVAINSNSSTGNLTLSMTGVGVSPAALSSLTCANGSITGAGTDACTVSLTAAAPAGGMLINLASNNSAVTLPASVTVTSGSTSAAFSASVAAVSASQTTTLTASAGSVTRTFSLQLKAATPTLTASTTSVNFGTVAVGKVATQTVTLTSSGNGPVTISALSVTGSLFSASGIATPLTLNPGQAATLILSFSSVNGGPFTGALTITSNSSAGNLAVNMSAASVGVLTSVTCSSSSMSGTGSDTCSVNLNGKAPAGGYLVALNSNNSSVKVPSTVTVAQSAMSASFNATVAAVSSSQTATITASAGGVVSSFALALNPSAVGTLAVNATSVPFGEVYVGQSSTQSVTLTASGGSVVISSATVTGSGFKLSGLTLPLTLTSGQSATLDVEFAPTATGSVTGQLTIQSNSAKGTINLALSGDGAGHSVVLNWNASSGSSVVGYNIYRVASGSASYTRLNSSVNQTTTFTDTVCHNGQAYQYYVTSVDSAGKESVPSNTITVTIPQ